MTVTPALSAVPLRRAAISFALLAALLALFAGGKAILYDTMDPDAFWHMRVAGQLQQDGIGPLTDTLSFDSIRQPWTPYSWLAELGMKALWDSGGYRAAVAVQALMMAGIVSLLAASCAIGAESSLPFFHATPWDTQAPARPRTAAIMATAFGAYLTLPNLSFRPVTAALLLLMLCAWLLLRDRRWGEKTAAVWCLPVIAAITTNIHFYAFLIPVWVAALLCGAMWERRQCRSAGDRPLAGHHAKRYAILLGLTLLACCLTPMLPGAIRSMIYYQWHDPMVHSPIIAEMQPFTSGTGGKFSALIVVLVTACAVYHRQRIRAGERIWLAIGLVLLFQLGRFAPLYAMIGCPILAVTLPGVSDRALRRPALAALMAGVLLAGLVRVALSFPRSDMPLSTWLNRHAPDAPGYPAEAVDFVADHVEPAGGRLINEFSWGGYLSWRLGDRYQVLLDGRTQVYSPELWKATYLGSAEDCRRFLSNTRADAAILPAGKSRFRDALLQLGWTRVHRDAMAEVLVPPPAEVAHTE